MRLVVDSSAMLAIREQEPGWERFHGCILAGRPVMSVATLAELTMVWQARFGTDTLAELDEMLEAYGVLIEPVAADDRSWLRRAITAYGKGRRAEPACLNFGDLFAYALARRLDLPLLWKGDDFARTDIRAALAHPDEESPRHG